MGRDEMIEPWYIAVEPFDPSFGDNWANYMAGTELPQLEEVVSLDASLCPSVIGELEGEDWEHNVHEDGLIDFFRDLDHLLERVRDLSPVNILAAVLSPAQECRGLFADSRFGFKGYDLIGLGMSALTNCGGFPLAFQNAELSRVGLISTLSRAQEVAGSLREHYANDNHADCEILALWKMVSGARA
ncbi:MAG: hypothetical protein JSW27_19015 [Phycisphaerales bacterium]|nr:MAG: hypothetical protein JSW27_19015 [Phycisphaerales bacterium]